MSETRYSISEMAKMLQLEPHVLRYWEEELGFSIGRNEMGHRYYTEKDLQHFLKAKELKKNGMQLRDIKEQLVDKDTKIVEFCGKGDEVQEKEKSFYEILERMIGEISQNNKKEGRYRRLDEAIRSHQQSRRMVAATEEANQEKHKPKNKTKTKNKKKKGA